MIVFADYAVKKYSWYKLAKAGFELPMNENVSALDTQIFAGVFFAFTCFILCAIIVNNFKNNN